MAIVYGQKLSNHCRANRTTVPAFGFDSTSNVNPANFARIAIQPNPRLDCSFKTAGSNP